MVSYLSRIDIVSHNGAEEKVGQIEIVLVYRQQVATHFQTIILKLFQEKTAASQHSKSQCRVTKGEKVFMNFQ